MNDTRTLGELQRSFSQNVGLLLTYVYSQGYAVTLGESYRTVEQAQWDVVHHTGILGSVHCLRLAIDLQLFDGTGTYLTDPVRYKFLGDYWKTLDAAARWGGDFNTVDADHFSYTHGGAS